MSEMCIDFISVYLAYSLYDVFVVRCVLILLFTDSQTCILGAFGEFVNGNWEVYAQGSFCSIITFFVFIFIFIYFYQQRINLIKKST